MPDAIKLVRVAKAPPGHKTPQGSEVTDPAEVAAILADPALARKFVKVPMADHEMPHVPEGEADPADAPHEG